MRDVPAILDSAASGGSLGADEIMALSRCQDLPLLASAADSVRRRLNPDAVVTYVVGRNINYTNVCWVRCRFCAFHRPPDAPDAYVLDHAQILSKVREMTAVGGIEALMQGGLNPKLKIQWFEQLFRAIKREFATDGVILHALSPAEVLYIARISSIGVGECLSRLREAGLDSLPGGGAEVLAERVRQQISPLKTSADEWLDCMREAHRLGIPTTATMMYGSVDTWEDRCEHLLRVRDLQSETGGFTAFIPWPYQPAGTQLGGARTGAFDYLKTLAISRLALQNVVHLQTSWVTQGPRIAQIALSYGADDLGSTMMEENVVSAAGCAYMLPEHALRRLIESACYEPARRTTQYDRLPPRPPATEV